MRKVSEDFIKALSDPEGILHPLLTRVKKDHTLMLAIRAGYINIYYRGGNIVKIVEQDKNNFRTFFDEKYNLTGKSIYDFQLDITNQEEAEKIGGSFASRKAIMDDWFAVHPKPEREFQQLVVRENNYSNISNQSEYFITDIEFAEPGIRDRFDMSAVRWPVNQRKNGSNCRPALIEMKYGDGALDGSAGLVKHLEDMETLVADKDRYAALLSTMESQFDQLDKLGLLNFNKGTSNARVKLSVDVKPELVFILANHNPRSSKLRNIILDSTIDAYAQSTLFDLSFYVASFAGYGLHTACMLPLDQFRKLL